MPDYRRNVKKNEIIKFYAKCSEHRDLQKAENKDEFLRRTLKLIHQDGYFKNWQEKQI
jgi:hypothetical protein